MDSEKPTAKAGGFGLRLKVGLIGHRPIKPPGTSSGSGSFWVSIYSFHTSSVTLPIVTTQ